MLLFLVTLVSSVYSPTSAAHWEEIRENLADGRPTAQSSHQGSGHDSGNAVDGVRIPNNKCTLTHRGDTNPWWRVDLQGHFTVESVVIYANNGHELSNAEVRIGYNDATTGYDVNPICNSGLHQSSENELMFSTGCVMNGKFVTIALPGRSSGGLSLCEVEVYGRKFKQSSACYYDDGADYRGWRTVTQSGRTCQAWNSQSPHSHSRTPRRYSSSGLQNNYCRNPDGSSQPWCYTTDPDTRWEYCFSAPKCEKKWRDDRMCGADFRLQNGDPAQCSPDHTEGFQCCSPHGYCGNSDAHCYCETCINYSDENIARGKTAIQSSTDHDGPAKNAIDGTRGGDYHGTKSCSHTYASYYGYGTPDPWWRVDLYNTYDIDRVVVVNRQADCCWGRLDGFQVRVGNSPARTAAANPICGPVATKVVKNKRVYTVQCAGGQRGRYVTVTLPGASRILTLCEVEVYRVPPNPCLHNKCDRNAVCRPGGAQGYTCTCNDYYQGDGFTCTKIDPCTDADCDANAVCSPTTGATANYTCTCRIGFWGDGKTCTKNDQCEENDCDINAECFSEVQKIGYVCVCNDGFEGDGMTCTRIDPCENNNCHQNADCIANGDSFDCKCHDGFEGDGMTCTRIDPCENNNCHQNADCTANGDSFDCKCHDGFEGDGVTCTNPCDSCHELADCTTNEAGAHECECRDGYQGNGEIACTDVNECMEYEGMCSFEHSVCKNLPGSFKCVCEDGYVGDVSKCEFNFDGSKPKADATVMAMNPVLYGKLGGSVRFLVKIRTENLKFNYELIKWSKLPDMNLSPPPVDYIKTPNYRRVLVVRTILPEDAGKYKVSLDVEGLDHAEETVELLIAEPITSKTENLVAAPGDSVKFEVHFNVWPNPGYRLISWRKGNKSLTPPKKPKYLTPKNRRQLVINNVEKADEGTYTVTLRTQIRGQNIERSLDLHLIVAD